MIIYAARQQVLNLSRSRHIWPKELQLLTRLTDKQAKNLANKYRQGSNHSRVLPYEDHCGLYNYHQERFVKNDTQNKVVDLTQKKSEENIHANQSPRLNYAVAQGLSEDYITETDKNDVPIAQIVIPSAKKVEISGGKPNQRSFTNEIRHSSQVRDSLHLKTKKPFAPSNLNHNFS